MNSRGVRIALCLLVAAAFGAAAYEIVLLERRGEAAREAARAFDDRAGRIEASIGDLQRAQFAYVADGQGSDFWTARADNLLARLANDLPKLVATSSAGDSQSEANAAVAALANVRQIDTNIQGYLRGDRRRLASDLIFSDLRDAVDGLRRLVERARASERAATEPALVVIRNTELATAAGASIFALLVLVLLVPRSGGASSRESGSDSILTIAASAPPKPAVGALDAGADLPLALDTMPVGVTGPGGETASHPRSPLAERAELEQAAELCTDFACLVESSQLPVLLERVARLLDAAGVIVWMDDASSGDLRPALSHGYPPAALARIHGISKDADNATAGAYRDREVRIVQADAGTGAIAVPILTAGGCVGVMAAEVKAGRERQAGAVALARIMAAQLATLVTPQPSIPEQ